MNRSAMLKIIGIVLSIFLILAGSIVASSKSTTANPVCECSKDKYNCKDFPLSDGTTAQQCYDYCKSIGKGDIHKLDRDKDGKACDA